MSEMVERVARALFEQSVVEADYDGTWDDLEDASQEHFAARARVAIKAMREPTDQLAFIGSTAFEDAALGEGKLVFDGCAPAHKLILDGAVDAWRAMIDDALV